MNRSLFWNPFATVFLAEVGDQTQLAARNATVHSGQLWTVFLATSAARAVGCLNTSPSWRSGGPRAVPSSRWACGC